MDEKPSEPCDETVYGEVADLHDRGVFTDNRHHALVIVSETGAEIVFPTREFGFFQTQFLLKERRDVIAHLGGGGGDTWNKFAIPVAHICQISGDEDIGMSGKGEIGVRGDASRAIRLHA